MANEKGGKKDAGAAAKKKAPEPKKAKSKKDLYSADGDKLTRKNRNCPKCGAGVFLAEHKDRST